MFQQLKTAVKQDFLSYRGDQVNEWQWCVTTISIVNSAEQDTESHLSISISSTEHHASKYSTSNKKNYSNKIITIAISIQMFSSAAWRLYIMDISVDSKREMNWVKSGQRKISLVKLKTQLGEKKTAG